MHCSVATVTLAHGVFPGSDLNTNGDDVNDDDVMMMWTKHMGDLIRTTNIFNGVATYYRYLITMEEDDIATFERLYTEYEHEPTVVAALLRVITGWLKYLNSTKELFKQLKTII